MSDRTTTTIRLKDLRIAVIAATLMLGACSSVSMCEQPEGLTDLQEKGRIVVPEDLDNLDPNRALDIPVATPPPRTDDECIDKPPKIDKTG